MVYSITVYYTKPYMYIPKFNFIFYNKPILQFQIQKKKLVFKLEK